MMKYTRVLFLAIVATQSFRYSTQISTHDMHKARNRRSSGLNKQIELKDCGYGVCQEVNDYPEEKIANLVEKSDLLKKYFASQIKVDISGRSGTPGKTLCPTMTQTYFYKKLNNTRDTEMYIVNHGDYQQGVVLETCVDDSSSCSSGDTLFDEKTKCEQRYSSRVLLALGKHSDQAEFDTFKLPSCCVCLIV
ncbi:unnamed protein product [Acanthoscelides obtectus]|uniref:Spaetzle domain-containing protein n=1 Tax=Acanthoscelides obtectus TaxID=200917 RepID=A0A9P0LA32_ACAOB|nr:unnamed protein product [Acanthoscelides obtectus]CAK1655295.1 Protein spaetzle 5 [Acanthoscelides obtectus]